MPAILSRYEDVVMQGYQTGYHTGYQHGINDASVLTGEDIKLISELEYKLLNEEDNEGQTLEEVYRKVADAFNKERTERLMKKARNGKK